MAKKDMLRKSVLLGIGLGALTKEKVEKYVKRLQREGHLDVGEGKKLAREMLAEGKRMEKRLRASVQKRVKMARKLKAKYKSKKVKPKKKSKKRRVVKRATKKTRSKPKKRRR